MNNSMITAGVSMNSTLKRLDMIADNIANMDTAGYKRKEASFEEVLTTLVKHHDDFDSGGRATPLGYTVGYGTRLSAVTLSMEQGVLQETGVATDLALEGQGLFVVDNAGTTGYSRDGSFYFAPDPLDDGMMTLVNGKGHLVLGVDNNPIQVDANAKVAIDPRGNVLASVGGQPADIAGRIQVISVSRLDGLEQRGDNLYVLRAGVDAQNVFGGNPTDGDSPETLIRSGYMEKSNVDVSIEMTNLIQAQRAYQLAARALSSSDTMMNLANNIRR